MLSELSTDAINECTNALGLDFKTQSVYVSVFRLGNSSAAKIAKEAKIPRSSVYDVLETLIKLGLVSKVKEDTVTKFSAAHPSKLLLLVENKQKVVGKANSLMQTHYKTILQEYNSELPHFPKVRYYEGVEGLKTVYYDALSSNEVLVLCQGNTGKQQSLKEDPPYLKDFIEEIELRKIKTKELLEETPASKEYKKAYDSPIHKIKIIPQIQKKNFEHVDKHIYQSKVAYISHDHLIGIIIEDKTIYENEKVAFERLWKYL